MRAQRIESWFMEVKDELQLAGFAGVMLNHHRCCTVAEIYGC